MSKIGVTAILLLVVVSSLGLIAAIAPGAGSLSASGTRPSAGPHVAAGPLTHGDLVVGPGQTYIIQPNLAGSTYYQGGNITVEAGGTLDVQNVTLSFVQYVANTGTAEQRLSHLYQFRDAGTVNFYKANLTTDVQVVNTYPKLNLSVTGTLNAFSSTFEFPGWIYVSGSSAAVTLNQSTITWNLAVQALSEPTAILGDTAFAPTISVVGGATFTLLASQVEHVYADNTLNNGFARPTPLTYSNPSGTTIALGNTGSLPVNGPSDSANLTLDYLYPAAGALSGFITVHYIGSTVANTSVNLAVVYGGNSYPVASGVNFVLDSTVTLTFPLPSNLLATITSGGMLQYLNETGDFGVPNVVDVSVQAAAGSYATVTNVTFQLNTTGPTYNDLVSGSTVSAVDSQLGFNWNLYNPSSGAAYSQSTPLPWNSNKWLFTAHSVGYLANITTPNEPLPGVFSASAILPDASSQVNFYRWAQFNLTGQAGVLPIQGASLSAYYAYDSNQANNATTTALNHIPTAVPAIWGYLQYWDLFHGVLRYGSSNAAGQGFLLLATGNLTGPTLPDGIFLGGYHVGISVPAVGVKSHWFNWSVSPYPEGVASASPNYNGPDFAPPQAFPDYFGSVTLSSISVTAEGLSSSTVLIGQTLGVHVVANDSGTATISQVEAMLYYNSNLSRNSLLAEYENTTLDLTAPGQQASFDLSWIVNDTVTGLHGWGLHHNLTLVFYWNYNIPSLAGGAAQSTVPIKINPSQLYILPVPAFSLPPSTLQLTDYSFYFANGTVLYNGSQPATLELWATPVSGGQAQLVASGPTISGNFSIPWYALSGILSQGTTYTLTATLIYNDREYNYSVPGTYSVPSPPSSPASFLFQKFLGLPVWLWIAIAGAAAVGIVLFLFVARRQAAGKLVECGECGNLIPEDATTCPKCGAEFEADLIRCSRCASTIPADSKFCPECAAQLLGKPGEAEADPEKQAYADFTGKYRAEAKRELGDNYTEGAFWDWWKRQPTYTPFSQWSLQQGQGTARAGMTAPPTGTETAPEAPGGKVPPRGGAPPPSAGPSGGTGAAAGTAAAPPSPSTAAAPPAAPGGAGLKSCPSCGKEIPAEYLVCPFCNAVTQ